MTAGENIRKIRQEKFSPKQLSKLVSASEAYVRVYESGRRNPQPKALYTIAVKVEVLTNSDFDSIKAMYKLFQVFQQFDGHLFECNGNDVVAVSFGTLSLMCSWCDRYEEYMNTISNKDAKSTGKPC